MTAEQAIEVLMQLYRDYITLDCDAADGNTDAAIAKAIIALDKYKEFEEKQNESKANC